MTTETRHYNDCRKCGGQVDRRAYFHVGGSDETYCHTCFLAEEPPHYGPFARWQATVRRQAEQAGLKVPQRA